jgi:hypothetical protein
MHGALKTPIAEEKSLSLLAASRHSKKNRDPDLHFEAAALQQTDNCSGYASQSYLLTGAGLIGRFDCWCNVFRRREEIRGDNRQRGKKCEEDWQENKTVHVCYPGPLCGATNIRGKGRLWYIVCQNPAMMYSHD